MDQKQQITERLQKANNILVTVSSNPSVDQLASCIGLTLALNKMGKHATAVFSGAVPSTLEFLQPEKTIETNTDSLRDFIISLDKSKADKLRYKVEDKVVKIFITPYRTSISDKDLEFSQGDFNVDVVLALGVHQQADLDQAITAHGRILHDATVMTVNVTPGGELGSINWLDTGASSLAELVTELVQALDPSLLDGQMATALLTGIVAETERFSNNKTSPATMSISAQLMSAGANQQLVATKLSEPPAPPEPPQPPQPPTEGPDGQGGDAPHNDPPEPPKPDDGTLQISHNGNGPADNDDGDGSRPPQIDIDEHGQLRNISRASEKPPEAAAVEKPADDGTIDPNRHLGGSRPLLPPVEPQKESKAEPLPSDPLSLPQPNADDEERPSGAPMASSTAVAPDMPYLPPSMRPGGDGNGDHVGQDGDHSAAQQPSVGEHRIEPPTFAAPPHAEWPSPVPPAPAPLPAPATPPTPEPTLPPVPPAPLPEPPQPPPGATLDTIEKTVHSPHVGQGMPPVFQPPTPLVPPAAPSAPEPASPLLQPSVSTPQPALDTSSLDSARDAVMKAFSSQQPADRLDPIHALNAQPLGDPLHTDPPAAPGLNLPPTSQPPLPPAPNAGGPNTPPPPSPPPMIPPTQ